MSTYDSPTSNDPDVIREEIEQTRRNRSRDVNALGESVTPSHLAKQQADKVKDKAGDLRDRIMGSASEAGSSTADRASGLGVRRRRQDPGCCGRRQGPARLQRPGRGPSSPSAPGGCWARSCCPPRRRSAS